MRSFRPKPGHAEEEDEAAGARRVNHYLEDIIWPKLAVGVFDFLDTTALG